MPFQRVLTTNQELRLVEDYSGGWTVKELTIIYKISERTVYRVLGRHKIPKVVKKRRKTARKLRRPRVLKPCGTNAAYKRHKMKGEYPCTRCLEAHARDVAISRKKGK